MLFECILALYVVLAVLAVLKVRKSSRQLARDQFVANELHEIALQHHARKYGKPAPNGTEEIHHGEEVIATAR